MVGEMLDQKAKKKAHIRHNTMREDKEIQH